MWSVSQDKVHTQVVHLHYITPSVVTMNSSVCRVEDRLYEP